MSWIVSVTCIIIAIFCWYKLQKKQQLDIQKKEQYEKDITLLEHRKNTLQNDIAFCEKQARLEQDSFNRAQQQHTKALAQQAIELDEFYERNKCRRMEQLENEMHAQEEKAQQILRQKQEENESQLRELEQQFQLEAENLNLQTAQLQDNVDFQQHRFESLLAPLQQYEKERQARLFYTIQVPEEYHNDIDYLLTTVTQKVNHPDIISKLVWAEYVKPYMDETFKRIEIKDEPGIYKITNIENGKCYIGKSTNVKKRLQDHFKSSVGISSIADQAIHHAILEDGIWNWTIEIITYTDKEHLNELEKYYIDFFHAQTHGYNKNSGGGG